MKPELFESFFSSWITKVIKYQRNNKGRYLHFDLPIRLVDKDGKPIQERISNLKRYFKCAYQNVPKHSFYPFIKSDIESPRVKHIKDPLTNKKRIFLDKKIRPICYAAHFDSLIFSWYSHLLTEMYQSRLPEWEIEESVLAYLKKGNQCNIHFAHQTFIFIKEKINTENTCVALAYDLSSYFDTIDHSILKKNWISVLSEGGQLPKDHHKVYRTLTKYCFIQKQYLDIRFPMPIGKHERVTRICEPFYFRQMASDKLVIEKNPFTNQIEGSKRFGEVCGIPQGSPISACLSNIYLIEFDRIVNSFAKRKKGIYRRYCDDLLIICSPNDLDFFRRLILRFLKRYEVLVNEKKTEVIHFEKEGERITSKDVKGNKKHLQYLGFEFDGKNYFIRSASMSRYIRKLNSGVFQAVEDAYDPEFSQRDVIFRKKLYKKFTHLGKRNFIRYGICAQKVMDDSFSIKKQISRSIERVERSIVDYKGGKEKILVSKGIAFKRMK